MSNDRRPSQYEQGHPWSRRGYARAPKPGREHTESNDRTPAEQSAESPRPGAAIDMGDTDA